jgi:hypothetical protein
MAFQRHVYQPKAGSAGSKATEAHVRLAGLADRDVSARTGRNRLQ